MKNKNIKNGLSCIFVSGLLSLSLPLLWANEKIPSKPSLGLSISPAKLRMDALAARIPKSTQDFLVSLSEKMQKWVEPPTKRSTDILRCANVLKRKLQDTSKEIRRIPDLLTKKKAHLPEHEEFHEARTIGVAAAPILYSGASGVSAIKRQFGAFPLGKYIPGEKLEALPAPAPAVQETKTEEAPKTEAPLTYSKMELIYDRAHTLLEGGKYKCHLDELNRLALYWQTFSAAELAFWGQTPIAQIHAPILPRPEKSLVVVGDTHGDLNAFLAPLIKNNVAHFKNPAFKFINTSDGREVDFMDFVLDSSNIMGNVIKIPNLELNPAADKEILYLGDTIDRGNHDPESLYLLNDILRQQKALGSENIKYVMGNHELMLMGGDGGPAYHENPLNTIKASRARAANIMRKLIVDDLAKLSFVKEGMHFSHSYLSESFMGKLKDHAKSDLMLTREKQKLLLNAIKAIGQNNLSSKSPSVLIERENSINAISQYLNQILRNLVVRDPDHFAQRSRNKWLLGEEGPLWCRCFEADIYNRLYPAAGVVMGVGHTISAHVGDHFSDKGKKVYSNVLAFDIAQSAAYSDWRKGAGANPGYGIFSRSEPYFVEERMTKDLGKICQ